MDSLRVDTGMLRQTGAYLRRVATEFAQQVRSERVAEATAHPGLAGAVRRLRRHLERRRQKMLTDLAYLRPPRPRRPTLSTTWTPNSAAHFSAMFLLGQSGVAASAAAPVEEFVSDDRGPGGVPPGRLASSRCSRSRARQPTGRRPRRCALQRRRRGDQLRCRGPAPPRRRHRHAQRRGQCGCRAQMETSPRTSPGRSSDTRLPAMPYAGTRPRWISRRATPCVHYCAPATPRTRWLAPPLGSRLRRAPSCHPRSSPPTCVLLWPCRPKVRSFSAAHSVCSTKQSSPMAKPGRGQSIRSTTVGRATGSATPGGTGSRARRWTCCSSCPGRPTWWSPWAPACWRW